MKSFVTDKINALPYSGIRKFFDVASEMKDVISLGVGEPDFYTPWNVREEAIYHLEKRRTIYTSNSGLMPLREEISKYTKRKYGLDYKPESQIMVTVGGSEAIDMVLRAVIDSGDEVLYHEPCYVSYMPCIKLAGGVPVAIQTKNEDEFRLTPDALERAITSKTKALILSYPNNPTGAVMERSDLEKIAEILRDKDILVISDEIYSELTYSKSVGEVRQGACSEILPEAHRILLPSSNGQNKHESIASLPGMYEKTLYINGFSKAFAMTGWRLGYACGSEDLISAMVKIHQYAIMCAPTTSQYAGVEALKNCDTHVEAMRVDYDARRRVMLDGFRSIGLDCFEPLGAFYCFPSIKSTGLTTDEFCNRLLFEEKVAVVPGTAFGQSGEGFIRCSYAYSIDNIKAALDRIGRFLKKLK